MASDLQNLVSLATSGLTRMFDERKRLFCHRLVRTDEGFVQVGHSHRYTIMTLLGLRELERSGGPSPFETDSLYKSFVSDTSWIQSAGDLGLLVWLVAEFEPDQIESFRKRLDLEGALGRYPDARSGRTMELAWFLTGLSHAATALPRLAVPLTDLAHKTYRSLLQNQGPHGYFGHLSTKKSIEGRLRGRVGSFADQIYPILALSKFATGFHMEAALPQAKACATAICRVQGALGQWWWLYDSRSGRVSSHYPVYSVHQHAMAPMGLFAFEAASGENYEEAIYKGLRWIYGANELGVDMRDCQAGVVWRCIRPKNKRVKYRDAALSLIGSRSRELPKKSLEVLYEDWPYELGWLLFAFAGKSVTEAENGSFSAPLLVQ